MNLLTVIPKSKFASWAEAEARCLKCDGTTVHAGERGPLYWLINSVRLPKGLTKNSVCFMAYDYQIRGYFDIVDTDASRNWVGHCRSLADRDTQCVVMANWHPLPQPISHPGLIRGWRYTELQP